MFEELLMRISTGQLESNAPCGFGDDGSDLKEFETNRAALRPGHLGANLRTPSSRVYAGDASNKRYDPRID